MIFCLVVIVFMTNGSLYINLLLYHDVFHIQVFYSIVMDQWNVCVCVHVYMCAEAQYKFYESMTEPVRILVYLVLQEVTAFSVFTMHDQGHSCRGDGMCADALGSRFEGAAK